MRLQHHEPNIVLCMDSFSRMGRNSLTWNIVFAKFGSAAVETPFSTRGVNSVCILRCMLRRSLVKTLKLRTLSNSVLIVPRECSGVQYGYPYPVPGYGARYGAYYRDRVDW